MCKWVKDISPFVSKDCYEVQLSDHRLEVYQNLKMIREIYFVGGGVLSLLSTVGRLMRPAKDVEVLILRTCDYVTLYGKRNFADVIGLRILRWRNDPGGERDSP